MLLVTSRVRSSAIHGLGCFVDEAVGKGTIVWEFHPGLDIRIPAEVVEASSSAIQEFLSVYAYTEKYGSDRVLVLCGDHTRHLNHASQPNLLWDAENYVSIAARDILAGEELTCNYFDFDVDAERKLQGTSASPEASPG